MLFFEGGSDGSWQVIKEKNTTTYQSWRRTRMFAVMVAILSSQKIQRELRLIDSHCSIVTATNCNCALSTFSKYHLFCKNCPWYTAHDSLRSTHIISMTAHYTEKNRLRRSANNCCWQDLHAFWCCDDIKHKNTLIIFFSADNMFPLPITSFSEISI